MKSFEEEIFFVRYFVKCFKIINLNRDVSIFCEIFPSINFLRFKFEIEGKAEAEVTVDKSFLIVTNFF